MKARYVAWVCRDRDRSVYRGNHSISNKSLHLPEFGVERDEGGAKVPRAVATANVSAWDNRWCAFTCAASRTSDSVTG